MSAMIGSDDFNGDTEHLRSCMKALVELDMEGALVPHGIGGHARGLLTAAYHRLALAQPVETGAALLSVNEKSVMVCPQCEGEGGYPDGLDEAACHTDCTRCDGNGWIVDIAALAQPVEAGEDKT